MEDFINAFLTLDNEMRENIKKKLDNNEKLTDLDVRYLKLWKHTINFYKNRKICDLHNN